MKNLTKVVAVMLMSMVATVVFAQTASQKESKPAVATLTSEDVNQIREALKTATFPKLEMGLWEDCLSSNNTPQEGVVGEDGMLCGQKVLAGDEYCVYITRSATGFMLWNDGHRPAPKKVVEDRSQIQSLDTARVETQFVTKQRTGKPQYGIDYHYTAADGTQGDIHTRRQDKYGVSLVLGGDYNLGADVTSFGGRIGLAYSVSDAKGKWSLKSEVDGILRRTKFNSNAENPGEPYTAYATELKAMPGLALGKHGEWRILVGPMLGWEFYRTDSRESILEDGSRQLLKSWGNFIYFGGVARVEYDWANGPVGFYAEGGYRLHKSVFQNADMSKQGVATFSFGVNVKLWRHESKF